jgi:hypothetical protein
VPGEPPSPAGEYAHHESLQEDRGRWSTSKGDALVVKHAPIGRVDGGWGNFHKVGNLAGGALFLGLNNCGWSNLPKC